MSLPRDHFPALTGPDAPLAYLDHAATCPTPAVVLDAVSAAARIPGSAGRGGHRGGHRATEVLEQARASIARQLHTAADTLVFTASATDALQGLARGLSDSLLPGEEIVTTALEHHANLLPWRRAAESTGARLRTARANIDGDLDLSHLAEICGPRTRIVALTAASNVTGAVVPIPDAVAAIRARAPEAFVVVDGTQQLAHGPVRPDALGCDAWVASGHKAYGPLGIGLVWSRSWPRVRPWRWGGGMVDRVGPRREEVVDGPARFEAGTPNHPGAAGLAAALDWLEEHRSIVPIDALTQALVQRLSALPDVQVLGRPRERLGIVSFVVAGVHPHDVGAILDAEGVAVRVGHHCAQPNLAHLGQPHAVRASLGMTSRADDLDALLHALQRVRHTFPAPGASV